MSHKKGNKKHKSRCEVYRKLGKREVNKRKKLSNYVRRNPNDKQAAKALGAL